MLALIESSHSKKGVDSLYDASLEFGWSMSPQHLSKFFDQFVWCGISTMIANSALCHPRDGGTSARIYGLPWRTACVSFIIKSQGNAWNHTHCGETYLYCLYVDILLWGWKGESKTTRDWNLDDTYPLSNWQAFMQAYWLLFLHDEEE